MQTAADATININDDRQRKLDRILELAEANRPFNVTKIVKSVWKYVSAYVPYLIIAVLLWLYLGGVKLPDLVPPEPAKKSIYDLTPDSLTAEPVLPEPQTEPQSEPVRPEPVIQEPPKSAPRKSGLFHRLRLSDVPYLFPIPCSIVPINLVLTPDGEFTDENEISLQ